MEPTDQYLRSIRVWLIVFVIGLILSGLTAFPLVVETRCVVKLLSELGVDDSTSLVTWLTQVRDALADTNGRYPFLAYGTDWLAFAHLVIAVAFIGPIRDPVRNRWVVDFGIIACVAVVPLALVAGYVRGIPWWWRLVDCSFGVAGVIPLLFARRGILLLQTPEADYPAAPPR